MTDGLDALTQQRATDLRTDPPSASRALTQPATDGDLTRYSIYIDAAGDAFLETVRAAGRRSRPKVDASRSAVVRLALSRLAQEMSAEQVIAELHTRARPTTRAVGRKRL